MRLHVHEWGDADAPPVVCLHGVTAHGERYKQLAEERWAKHFHLYAPDLRGHARSGWDGPWDFGTHVAEFMAEVESREPIADSVDASIDERHDSGVIDRARALADVPLHHEVLPDGRLRRRTSQDAVVSIYRELATPSPPPETLTMATLLLYAPVYGLVRDDHLEAYAGRVEPVPVPGLHMVMWSAFDETADAVERFLQDPRA